MAIKGKDIHNGTDKFIEEREIDKKERLRQTDQGRVVVKGRLTRERE